MVLRSAYLVCLFCFCFLVRPLKTINIYLLVVNIMGGAMQWPSIMGIMVNEHNVWWLFHFLNIVVIPGVPLKDLELQRQKKCGLRLWWSNQHCFRSRWTQLLSSYPRDSVSMISPRIELKFWLLQLCPATKKSRSLMEKSPFKRPRVESSQNRKEVMCPSQIWAIVLFWERMHVMGS